MTKSTSKRVVQSTTDSKFFRIKGKIFYAHLKEPETKGLYPSNAYKLDLSIDDAHVEALTSKGVQIKNKGDEKGNFVTLKSKNFQPKVLGEQGEVLDPVPLVGNGSEATITVSLYDNTEANVRAGKGGSKLLGLSTVHLTKLVDYHTPDLI